MEMYATLIGPAGAVSLTIVTGWSLPESHERMRDQGFERRDPDIWKGEGASIGYHSRTKRFDFQDPDECDLLGGENCYWDVSFLDAETVFAIFVREGEEGLWRELEQRYDQYFVRDTQPVETEA